MSAGRFRSCLCSSVQGLLSRIVGPGKLGLRVCGLKAAIGIQVALGVAEVVQLHWAEHWQQDTAASTLLDGPQIPQNNSSKP